jgi:hypothetical protein
MEEDDVKSGTRPIVKTGRRKRINTTELAADPLREPNGGYEGSRFNAVRHGVLSELTVLPWEDEVEYAKLLEALVEEYRPRGPTEDHLIEEIAGVVWRKRRLRLAEAGSYWKNVDKATCFSSDIDERRAVLTLDALLTTPAGTAKDIAEVQNRLTAVSRARDILQAGKAGAYKAAMAELDERTKAHWQEQIAPKLEDLDEIEDDDEDEPVMHYPADAAGLLGFLLCSVLPDCVTQLGSLGIRSLIRAQVLGETLDFQRLEPISRYEVHLDRKFERAVSMLIRLRELRQFNEAG